MITEFKKSVDGILSERLASPLYGTFIISWMLWNWKIIYLTIFISDSKIEGTKIDYIVENYSNHWYLITGPAISTLLLLTIMPILTISAYWLQLFFNDKRLKIKNAREKNQLLTIEQSNAIRKEIRDKEKDFNDLLVKKDETIKAQKDEISSLIRKIDAISIQNKKNDSSLIEDSEKNNSLLQLKSDFETDKDYAFLLSHKKAFDAFMETAEMVKNNQSFPLELDKVLEEFYLVNGIFEENNIGNIVLSDKGRRIYQTIFNKKFIVEYNV